MADNKGILSAAQEKELASLLDFKIKFNNKLIETVDGAMFKGIIAIVDDYGLDKLQENYQRKAQALSAYLFAKNWEKALIVVWELSSDIVKEYITKKE